MKLLVGALIVLMLGVTSWVGNRWPEARKAALEGDLRHLRKDHSCC